MADIDLVIKIPEEVYQRIKETSVLIHGSRGSNRRFDYILFNAVNTGTPVVDLDCAHRCEYCKYEKSTPSYAEPCESCSIKDLDMTNFIDNFEPKEAEK